MDFSICPFCVNLNFGLQSKRGQRIMSDRTRGCEKAVDFVNYPIFYGTNLAKL